MRLPMLGLGIGAATLAVIFVSSRRDAGAQQPQTAVGVTGRYTIVVNPAAARDVVLIDTQ